MATYKRCSCRDENGRQLGTKCPRLRRTDGSYADHGAWYFQLELEPEPALDDAGKPVLDSKGKPKIRRRFVRRGSWEKRKEAEAAQREAEAKIRRGVDPSRKLTVSDYLSMWLENNEEWSENTRRSYEQHCYSLWIPQLGHLQLDQLRSGAQVAAALDTMDTSKATKQRYRATLRAALNDAMSEGLVEVNAAKLAKVASGKRPKPRIWTAARVVQFEADVQTRLAAARQKARGQTVGAFKIWRKPELRPSQVMVWTPAQVGRFLKHAYGHKWYALYHVIAFRGLRRGEACGILRDNLDLETGILDVAWQITKGGGVIREGKPKTDDSDAQVVLDTATVAVLSQHLATQARRRTEWGSAWTETGYVFTNDDGSRLDPDTVTDQFERLAWEAGCPPIRLHDLRHSAASIMHTAGNDMKTISETLRHSTIVITSDTYTSVFDDFDRNAAEATAAVVPTPWLTGTDES